MRRVWFLVLALVFFLVPRGIVWAGAPVEIVLWHSYRAEERRALERVIEVFHKKQKKIRVKVLAIPYDAYADKISAAIPRGHGPDLFIFAHDRIGDWAKNKIIEPITFWVTPQLLSRFFPKTVRMLAYSNALYGLPLAYKSTALFYNRALVKNPPKTTAELIALAKKLTDAKKGRFGLAYEATNFYHHALWLHGFGGRVFGKKGTLRIADKAAIKALDFARSLKHRYHILPAEPTSTLISSLFNAGKVAMVINGPWFRGEINAKIDYGVVKLPIVSETKKAAAPFLTSEAILLSKMSKKKRVAFEVMKYLTSDEAAMIRMLQGKQPVANVAIYKKSVAKKDAILRAFFEQMKLAVPMPNIPEMQMVWSPMLNALGRAFRETKVSSKVLLDEAKREILSYLKAQKTR